MLIIVKLPFAIPDKINEYERSLYADFNEYKRKSLIPDMLLKLKQGFGRLIRAVSDTGVVAILDSRVNLNGRYREIVLNALPKCRVTKLISEVAGFYRDKKSPGYFV
jgi:ATP-dependent DNA helicase DinG